MTVAALIASDTEKGETVRVAPQPERPGKCYHEFRDWHAGIGPIDWNQYLNRQTRSVKVQKGMEGQGPHHDQGFGDVCIIPRSHADAHVAVFFPDGITCSTALHVVAQT